MTKAVKISTPSTPIMFSKDHWPLKGTRSLEEMAGSRSRA